MKKLDNMCKHCNRCGTDCPRDVIGTNYCTDYRPQCQATQSSDQKHCVRCNLTWDMNDPEPPACLSNKELGQAAIAQINCELCGTWERNLVEGACKECRAKHYGTCECGGDLMRGHGFCEKGYGTYKVCIECLNVTEFEKDVD